MTDESKIVLVSSMALEKHDFSGVSNAGFIKDISFGGVPDFVCKPSRDEPFPAHYRSHELRQIAQILESVSNEKR